MRGERLKDVDALLLALGGEVAPGAALRVQHARPGGCGSGESWMTRKGASVACQAASSR
jgi:hypothetical protein